MKKIIIPKSCGKCRYGNTFDLSIDDLCTYCMILDCTGDWCDFPNREDNTLRMRGCPLPNTTVKQFKDAERRLQETKKRAKILHQITHGKTKLIYKRNLGRAKKLADKLIR